MIFTKLSVPHTQDVYGSWVTVFNSENPVFYFASKIDFFYDSTLIVMGTVGGISAVLQRCRLRSCCSFALVVNLECRPLAFGVSCDRFLIVKVWQQIDRGNQRMETLVFFISWVSFDLTNQWSIRIIRVFLPPLYSQNDVPGFTPGEFFQRLTGRMKQQHTNALIW